MAGSRLDGLRAAATAIALLVAIPVAVVFSSWLPPPPPIWRHFAPSLVSGFFRVALPMARPWIAGGLALVLMETLADFGAVAIFNYDTFTTAIYKAWYSLFSLPAAAQLASMLLLIVLALVLTEAVLRPRRRYHTARPGAPGRLIVLSRRLAAFAFFYCAAILALAFVLPMGQLLLWAYEVLPHDLDGRYLDFLGHTLTLALAAAALTAAAALILVYAVR